MTNEEKRLIYGKKVFFLTQNKFLIDTIRNRLLTMEYEIYILNDYKIMKNILKENPDSILFITPDFRLSLTGWKNFIRIITDEFDSAQIGILANDMSENEINVFRANLEFKAGFEQINSENMEETLQYIVKTLDTLDSKGMRQYVRASCLDDYTTEVFWIESDKMHKFRIVDVSSVGIAIQLPAKYYPILKEVKTISDARLVLKAKHIPISFDVKMIKPSGSSYILIAMFQMGIKKESLTAIRNYISNRLFENLLQQISSHKNDETDYDNLSDSK